MAAPPPRGGLSLYDNLTDPNDPTSSAATISSAPVLYNQNDSSNTDATPKKPLDPALRFQPIRRPQVKQASKAKPSFPKAIPKASAPGQTNDDPAPTQATVTATGPAPPKSSLADWAATEEDEWLYGTGEKRQRGGRKNKRKKQGMHIETDWNELYDPSRPTNIDEYLKSDEKVDEVREWKALLHRHRRKQEESDSSDGEARPAPSHQFAPPPSFNAFAPPPASPPSAPAPPPPDTTGDDAYARRLALYQNQPTKSTPAPPPPPPQHSIPPPPPSNDPSTISAAPVRYTQPNEPEQDEEDPDDERPVGLGASTDPSEPAPRSSRPGQAGFAARLMNKYGWTKGTGLGADESGIVNPLRVQVEKRRKKADADGGGWAEPGGKGKIIGGSKRKEDAGRFGAMSDVIVLRNMLENMADLHGEIADGLGQEIGEECGEKYGRVERLYIDQDNRQVFIKFTDQVSALRAVNELDGRVFNGNTIEPSFYDSESFDNGKYTR